MLLLSVVVVVCAVAVVVFGSGGGSIGIVVNVVVSSFSPVLLWICWLIDVLLSAGQLLCCCGFASLLWLPCHRKLYLACLDLTPSVLHNFSTVRKLRKMSILTYT